MWCKTGIAVDEERLLGAAHQEFKAGNYKQALQHCSLVHEKNPQQTDVLLLLGAIYYQVSVYQDASHGLYSNKLYSLAYRELLSNEPSSPSI